MAARLASRRSGVDEPRAGGHKGPHPAPHHPRPYGQKRSGVMSSLSLSAYGRRLIAALRFTRRDGEPSEYRVLTVDVSLMYHPQVGHLPLIRSGRLLKLVDRTDLGSVGENHESSSLSPPTIHRHLIVRDTRWFAVKREWLSGRASPCQGESHGFDPRLPL